ncbi:sodium-dependent transporter [Schaalia meyeri]|uniref:Sodium-dependent transporter n=1 Tax=Schaalia meyeri TaxID=52773 RepID=A0AAQ0BXC0_9ACTO|nr:sodium-dependent transporter [Schaalia meyeri]QQC44307.1 sodium-dependent transporter [Schaalia meyeri]SDR65079.1 neurotransmitter:Na+ symporter, NSS family [Schaalia meyeri]
MSSSAPRARDSWSGQTGFLLAAIGSAIGLGNIWRFPGVAYSNGGGAFLVPYLVALVFVGIPMLWLDYAVGHKFRGSPPWALRKVIGGGEFVGWFQTFVCFVIMVYYGAVLAWSVEYTIYSVNTAWGEEPTSFFTDSFLQVVDGTTFSWAPAWPVMIPLALVWILVLLVIGRGLSKGVEAANKIFLPLLVVLFLALVVRALFLPGATEGLNAFFTPNWSSLANPQVWLAAFAQIFYSLSVGFGIMLTYASYLKPKSNLTGTALVAGFANSSFEILAGIGVFSAVGFMAHQRGVAMSGVEGLSGPILSFVTFPKIISMMPGGPIFGVLFFSSLVLAGVTSLLSLLQVVSGGLQDKFGWSPPRSALVLGIPATVISLALFGTRSGLNNLDIVDNFINSIGVVSSAILFALLCALAGPGLSGLRAHLNSVSSVKVPKLWEHLVGIVIPVVLFVMMTMSLVALIADGYGSYRQSFVMIFGWGSVLVAILAALVLTFVPWKHRRVNPHATVARILADEGAESALGEGENE